MEDEFAGSLWRGCSEKKIRCTTPIEALGHRCGQHILGSGQARQLGHHLPHNTGQATDGIYLVCFGSSLSQIPLGGVSVAHGAAEEKQLRLSRLWQQLELLLAASGMQLPSQKDILLEGTQNALDSQPEPSSQLL